MTRRPRPHPPPQADLFGDAGRAPSKAELDQRLVELPLTLCDQSEDAWLLRPGLKGAPAKWAPKSLVERLDGGSAGLFRLPRWLARDRGWG
jgi:hypothetical protein